MAKKKGRPTKNVTEKIRDAKEGDKVTVNLNQLRNLAANLDLPIEKLAFFMESIRSDEDAPMSPSTSAQKLDQGEEAEKGTEMEPATRSRSWADESDSAECAKTEVDLGPPLQTTAKAQGGLQNLTTGEGAAQGKPQATDRNTYSEVVRGNRTGGSGFGPRDVQTPRTPGSEVVISEEEWKQGGSLWKHAIMGVVVSHKPSYAEMVKWVAYNWKEGKPQTSQVRPGVFLFEFKSEDEKIAILSKRWTYYNRFPFVLKAWNIDEGFEQSCFNTVPVWIQLPGLPARLWATESLRKIAEFIGKPVTTDTMTASRLRLDFARVLVEVDQNGKHPDVIPITIPGGGSIKQKVVYEWRIVKCGECGLIGHAAAVCRRPKQLDDRKSNPIKEVNIVKEDSAKEKGKEEIAKQTGGKQKVGNSIPVILVDSTRQGSKLANDVGQSSSQRCNYDPPNHDGGKGTLDENDIAGKGQLGQHEERKITQDDAGAV